MVNAGSPAEAVIAFSREMSDIHPDRTVAVNENGVALREDDTRVIKENGVECRKGIEAPYIETVMVDRVN